MKKIVLAALMISQIAFSAIKYEDLPKDHWAYSSVSNLVEKGIIPEDTYLFRGEAHAKRYDMAFYLSQAFNKLNTEKASKRDLDTLEALVSEFSVELTKVGYDTSTFNAKLDNIYETLELLKNSVEENQKTIKALEERLKKLE